MLKSPRLIAINSDHLDFVPTVQLTNDKYQSAKQNIWRAPNAL